MYQISLWTNNFEFLDQVCPKKVFPVKNRESEYHHWILHFRINLSTKFQLKLTILIFWTKIVSKWDFRSHTTKSPSSSTYLHSTLHRISAKRYSQGKAVFYSVHHKNGCLAASDLFHMFTRSVKFYTFHYHLLKVH